MILRTASALGAAILFSAALVPAQEKKLACSDGGNDKPNRVCEMREMNVATGGGLNVDASPNGGVRVSGWDRKEILVRARVEAWGETQAEAKSRLAEVNIATSGGNVKANGPKSGMGGRWGEQKWSVSYEVFAPRRTDLQLRTVNGGIRASDLQGRLTAETVNGGISLSAVNGAIKGKAVNGGISVDLGGARWEGEGLEVETVNGGVSLTMPDSYQASLQAETVNGGLHSDFPGAAVEGKAGGPRRMDLKTGGGGAAVKVRTVNGGVRIRRKA